MGNHLQVIAHLNPGRRQPFGQPVGGHDKDRKHQQPALWNPLLLVMRFLPEERPSGRAPPSSVRRLLASANPHQRAPSSSSTAHTSSPIGRQRRRHDPRRQPTHHFHLGDVQQLLQAAPIALQQSTRLRSDTSSTSRASSALPICFALRASSRLLSASSRTKAKSLQSLMNRRIDRGRKTRRLGEELQVHAGQAVGDLRHVLPDLVRGKAEQGSHQPHQRFGDGPQHRLRGTPRRILRRKGVNPVFHRIHVERAQLGHRKFIQRVINAMEFKRPHTSAGSFPSARACAPACIGRAAASAPRPPHPAQAGSRSGC